MVSEKMTERLEGFERKQKERMGAIKANEERVCYDCLAYPCNTHIHCIEFMMEFPKNNWLI
jgi:hypothetical protein